MNKTVYIKTFIVCLGLLIVVAFVWGFTFRNKKSQTEAACGRGNDISANIDKLSLGGSEGDQALERVISMAKVSPACRAETINELIGVMNKPDLNLADRPS